MSKSFPSYYLLAKHYEPVDVDNKQASAIAGLKKTIANACAVRLSFAFNHISGHEIPGKPSGVHGHVWKGVNGNYILGSKGFANYLSKTYGEPAMHKPAHHLKHYKDRRGILFFDVRIWSDASGHVALWDGEKSYRGGYFDQATRVWFWEMPSGPGALVSAYL
jgi:hypothetical protein